MEHCCASMRQTQEFPQGIQNMHTESITHNIPEPRHRKTDAEQHMLGVRACLGCPQCLMPSAIHSPSTKRRRTPRGLLSANPPRKGCQAVASSVACSWSRVVGNAGHWMDRLSVMLHSPTIGLRSWLFLES